jgi:hypothetical protein
MSLDRDTYHFVRHDNQIELLRKCGDEFELFLRKNFANRIVRSIYDNHLSAGGNGTA